MAGNIREIFSLAISEFVYFTETLSVKRKPSFVYLDLNDNFHKEEIDIKTMYATFRHQFLKEAKEIHFLLEMESFENFSKFVNSLKIGLPDLKKIQVDLIVRDRLFYAEKWINMLKELKSNFSLIIALDEKNVFLCYDIYSKYRGADNISFVIYNQTLKPEEKFDLSIFFEELSRDRRNSLRKRLLYRKVSSYYGLNSNTENMWFWNFNGVLMIYPDSLRFSPEDSDFKKLFHSNETLKNYNIDYRNIKSEIKTKKCFICNNTRRIRVGIGDFISFIKVAVKNKKHLSKTSAILRKAVVRDIKDAKLKNPRSWNQVLITGWYGTETTGDKAILGEILNFINESSPSCKVVLTTINRKISLQTQREIDLLKEVEIIDIEDGCKEKIIEQCDAVIFGGGPIMESRALIDVWRIFNEANRQRKARVIFGCGLGPFHTKEMEKIAGQILQMSTSGFFRDAESLEYSLKLFPDNNFEVACDPSLGYLHRRSNKDRSTSKMEAEVLLSTLLRASTNEFIEDRKIESIDKLNKQFAQDMANIFKNLISRGGIFIQLLSMNSHYLGGDDRLFNRLIENYCDESKKLFEERAYLPLEEMVERIKHSDISIAMRYHGHLFSFALGVPFLSINYTGKKGKIESFLKRINYERWSFNWKVLDTREAEKKLYELIEARKEIKEELQAKQKKLLNDLFSVYNHILDN